MSERNATTSQITRYTEAMPTTQGLSWAVSMAKRGGVDVGESQRPTYDFTAKGGARCRVVGSIVWWKDTGSWEYLARRGISQRELIDGLLCALEVRLDYWGDPAPARRLRKPCWRRAVSKTDGRPYIWHGICRVLDDDQLLAESGVSLEIPDTVPESLMATTETVEIPDTVPAWLELSVVP